MRCTKLFVATLIVLVFGAKTSEMNTIDTTIIHPVELPEEYINRKIITEEIKPFPVYVKPNNGTSNTL
jgi:hypothetical protein